MVPIFKTKKKVKASIENKLVALVCQILHFLWRRECHFYWLCILLVPSPCLLRSLGT